ncbi:MAG TPA: site-2 protease family protein [Syntrophomonadaceae bacterium]|nr:site-2 protease family protein [Syntrophomonadaceae bacterium]
MSAIIDIFIWLPAILIALTFHEFAHAYVANKLGDDTSYHQGRLTLNPLPHIDWVGFIMLIIFKFGWAKPVQVNPYNFKNTGVKKGMMLVSLAGPAMNIILAILGMIMLKLLSPYLYSESAVMAVRLIQPLVQINLILAVFNLLPVPPLDGSKVLAGLLPDSGANVLYSLEQYGPLILILLIFTGVISKVLFPLVNALYGFLYFIFF